MNLGAKHQFNAIEVTRTEIQLLAKLLRAFDQQNGLLRVKLIQRVAEVFGLPFLNSEVLDHHQFPVGDLRSHRGPQRAKELLARECVFVAAGLRAVNRAAAPPKRAADGADTRAASALLLPKLFACARYQLAVLGSASPLPKATPRSLHRRTLRRGVQSPQLRCPRGS